MTDNAEESIEEIVQRAVAIEGVAVPATLLRWTQGEHGLAWPSPSDVGSFADSLGKTSGEIWEALLVSLKRGPTEDQKAAASRKSRAELSAALDKLVSAGEISRRQANRALRRAEG